MRHADARDLRAEQQQRVDGDGREADQQRQARARAVLRQLRGVAGADGQEQDDREQHHRGGEVGGHRLAGVVHLHGDLAQVGLEADHQERGDRADDQRAGLPLRTNAAIDEAQHEEADEHAPPAVDRLQPRRGIAHRRDDWPWHSGQSGQPMPEPVLRTMTPMTTMMKVDTTAMRAIFWKRDMHPGVYRGDGTYGPRAPQRTSRCGVSWRDAADRSLAPDEQQCYRGRCSSRRSCCRHPPPCWPRPRPGRPIAGPASTTGNYDGWPAAGRSAPTATCCPSSSATRRGGPAVALRVPARRPPEPAAVVSDRGRPRSASSPWARSRPTRSRPARARSWTPATAPVSTTCRSPSRARAPGGWRWPQRCPGHGRCAGHVQRPAVRLDARHRLGGARVGHADRDDPRAVAAISTDTASRSRLLHHEHRGCGVVAGSRRSSCSPRPCSARPRCADRRSTSSRRSPPTTRTGSTSCMWSRTSYSRPPAGSSRCWTRMAIPRRSSPSSTTACGRAVHVPHRRQGNIAAKVEGIAGTDELRAALDAVLARQLTE